jgi:hypothetical protein
MNIYSRWPKKKFNKDWFRHSKVNRGDTLTHRQHGDRISQLLFLKIRKVGNKKFWEELVAYFPLIRHGPHGKRDVQQLFSCCVCIRCRDNLFTVALPSNDRGLHIQTHRLMGGIYEVRHWHGLTCHDIHIKFHKDWFMHWKVIRGDT